MVSRLQENLKLFCVTALDEEGVRIVAIGQENAARGDALRVQTLCQLLRGLLSAAVGVDIEGEINRAWTVAQLLKLFSAEMGAQRAGWRWRKPACHNTARSNRPSTRITVGNWRTNSHANKPPLEPGRNRWAKAAADTATVEV